MSNSYDGLIGKTAREAVVDNHGNTLIEAGATITLKHAKKLSQLPAARAIKVVPLTDAVVYISADYDKLLGKTAKEAVVDDNGNTIIKAGTTITSRHIGRLAQLPPRIVRVVPFVSDEVAYLSADEEDKYNMATLMPSLTKMANL